MSSEIICFFSFSRFLCHKGLFSGVLRIFEQHKQGDDMNRDSAKRASSAEASRQIIALFSPRWIFLLFVVSFSFTWTMGASLPGRQPQRSSYQELLTLFEQWREFQKPGTVNGIPDYSRATMSKQYAALAKYQRRLAALDTAGWQVSQQVDYLLVRAEMNGMDFDHRVLKPWARTPGFYAVLWPSQADTPAREGAVAFGAIELWTYRFPLNSADAAKLATEIDKIPKLLVQARRILLGKARDLWAGGIRRMKEQSEDLSALDKRIPDSQRDLRTSVQRARQATDGFVAWLERLAPTKRESSGVGAENYNWYLKNVHLLPYTWQEEVTMMRRELSRAHAALKLEENRNRNLPPISPVATAEEQNRLFQAAVTEYMAFLQKEEIVSIRDYLDPALREQSGGFTPPGQPLEFFSEVSSRDQLVMRTHGYHWIDLARMNQEPHPSPIRRSPLLYNLWDSRAEGLATGMEEMMMHAGLFDSHPRTRELIWILLAQRAARALGGLYMHGAGWTMDQAVKFASEWTPRGWLKESGNLVWFEQDLYLRQPGYGTSYLTGKIEIEKLMTERSLQLGDRFTLKQFMDEVNAAGMIPISLIRWEITGLDDEIKSMQK